MLKLTETLNIFFHTQPNNQSYSMLSSYSIEYIYHTIAFFSPSTLHRKFSYGSLHVRTRNLDLVFEIKLNDTRRYLCFVVCTYRECYYLMPRNIGIDQVACGIDQAEWLIKTSENHYFYLKSQKQFSFKPILHTQNAQKKYTI